jgi:glycosyltransferase involved in cell wall biosynthesis
MTNPLHPTVSIAIPVFNGAAFIRQAIETALSQTFRDFELLISDNASEDTTASICREYAALDGRVRYVQQDTNRGPFWNLKFVTDQALGRYLVWLAHDDALDREYLERCIEQIQNNPRSVLVSGDFRIVDEAGVQIRREILAGIREQIPWDLRCTEFFKYPIFSNVFYCFYGMARTDLCRKIFAELKPPKYMSQIELPVLARLAVAGEISSHPTIIRDYRIVNSSLYHTEVRSLAGKSIFLRLATQFSHGSRLIADQVWVLIASSFTARRKCKILARLVRYYCLKMLEVARKAINSP